ncbi:unnamed protein product [Fusarium venenatum]|uniref:Uncharacterized protein n=1 Tax=Fusarium venenatum TaxID=56646 RepID=A0A2L2T0Q1_9HYPO|nr:uncharacterized protein FVRRES_12224 [Fusarium venenatum]CEI39533.1 unnamed protein product [Fusarium venenatum]
MIRYARQLVRFSNDPGFSQYRYFLWGDLGANLAADGFVRAPAAVEDVGQFRVASDVYVAELGFNYQARIGA